MAKVKEQVKFNPKYSEAKRVDKVRYAITGNLIKIINAIYIIIALSMLLVFFIEVIDNKNEAKDLISIFMTNGMMMLLFISLYNIITVPNKKAQKNNSKIDGCVFAYSLFTHLPVKKISLLKMSFRYYLLSISSIFILSIIFNIAVMVNDTFSYLKGAVGFNCTFLTLVAVMYYFSIFPYYFKKRNEKTSKYTGIALLLFYLFWFATTTSIIEKIYDYASIEALGGPVSLIISLVSFIVIIVYQKKVVEKKTETSSWYCE